MSGAERSGKPVSTGPPPGAVDPGSLGVSPRVPAPAPGGATAPSGGGGAAVAPGGSEAGPAPPGQDTAYRISPRLALLALGLCLAGFVIIAVQLYAFKFQGIGPTLEGLPSRVLFVFALTLAVSPLVLAIVRRPPVLFVVPGIALVFLLYPLFAPLGVPYGLDPIFNFQFAYALLQSGHWVPGAGGITLQATAYAFYPGSGVFNAELSAFTGVPLVQTILWGVPLLRLLTLPPTIYALAKRYFGQRVGLVSVLIFLGTPSILFNAPVQSEFAIPFMALTLAVLGYLVVDVPDQPNRIVLAAVLLASFVVISHHLTSYALAAWLGILLVVSFLFRTSRRTYPWRAAALFGSYLAFFAAFTLWVSLPNLLANYALLQAELTSLVSPSNLAVSSATSIGASFPEYQLVWTYLAYLGLIIFSLLALRRWLRTQPRRFMTPNLTVSLIAVIVTLPLLVTGFNFLAERIMEYGEIFMAPAIAWWVTQRVLPAAGTGATQSATARPARRSSTLRRYAASGVVILLVVLIFAGGSLVPYSTRDQFAAPSAIYTDSPLHIDLNSYALGIWAHSHLNSSTYVWGDLLTYCVFGGFGQFNMEYNQYMLFNGTTIPLSVWTYVTVGSYVVLDKYMTTSTPQFPGPEQPTAPMTPAQLAKFNNPAFFDLVYQDSTFTIYEVIAVP